LRYLSEPVKKKGRDLGLPFPPEKGGRRAGEWPRNGGNDQKKFGGKRERGFSDKKKKKKTEGETVLKHALTRRSKRKSGLRN